jgi:RNase H-like domain found in reverse transcriptase
MPATLAQAPSSPSAHPMTPLNPFAFNSCFFKGVELNYPVHKKELLVIIHTLSKWQTDLLSCQFEIWTDHKTLECFEKQCDLSSHQECWMEFLSQYDAPINYISEEKNCVADALSLLNE